MAVLLDQLAWLPREGRRLSEHDPSLQQMGGITVSDYLAAFHPRPAARPEPPQPRAQTYLQWLRERRAQSR